MRRTFVSIGVSALAVALALGGSARADTISAEAPSSPVETASAPAPIGDAALRLERTFSDQFVKGQIDRAALAPLVDDAIRSFPERLRPSVEAHVNRVIDAGLRLAPELTTQQRAALASASAPKALEPILTVVVNPAGVPIAGLGWGGLGAFGFPGAYNCIPSSSGYAYPYGGLGWNGFTSGFSAGQYSSLVCGGGFGYGLGGGWGW